MSTDGSDLVSGDIEGRDFPAVATTGLGAVLTARRRARGAGVATVGVAGDLERRVPVDLLDDRASETLSTWLQAHPGVKIICRDHTNAYALGARAGAPDVQQLPDRWHLLKNIGEVLERVLHQHRRAIDDAVSRDGPEPAEATTAAPALLAADAADTTVLLVGPATRSTSSVETSSAEVVVEEPRTARELAFEQVHVLHATGLSTRAVTEHLGFSRITVRKYMRAEQARAQNHRGRRPSVRQWRRGTRPRADRAGD